MPYLIAIILVIVFFVPIVNVLFAVVLTVGGLIVMIFEALSKIMPYILGGILIISTVIFFDYLSNKKKRKQGKPATDNAKQKSSTTAALQQVEIIKPLDHYPLANRGIVSDLKRKLDLGVITLEQYQRIAKEWEEDF